MTGMLLLLLYTAPQIDFPGGGQRPSDFPALGAFDRRHRMGRPALLFQSGERSLPAGVGRANQAGGGPQPDAESAVVVPLEFGGHGAGGHRLLDAHRRQPMPTNTVTTALQRNHHKARGISLGTTMPRDLASSSCRNGMFTSVKKYNRPTQAIPATKCIQRSTIKMATSPPGKSICGAVHNPISGTNIWPPKCGIRWISWCRAPLLGGAQILHHTAMCLF